MPDEWNGVSMARSQTTGGETHAFLWENGVMTAWARGWAVASAWPTASTPQARWWA
jgi:uncharacterized membrane protein